MRRLALAVLAAGCLVAAPASADEKPDAAHMAKASEEFEAGVAAYKKKDFDAAAGHFEAADGAVPSPGALRQAVRARAEAGQGALAATLAAQALERYPDDKATAKLARDVVEKFEPVLHKLHVRCAAPCTLSVGQARVPGEAAKSWIVYLDAGAATVTASFGGKAGKGQDVDAKTGGEGDLSFEPPQKKVKKVAPAVAAEPTKSELPPEDAKAGDAKAGDAGEPKQESSKGISPAFFGVSLAATVGLGAATIWSGIDTLNNPGSAAVMAACQGKGPGCPLYQEGLAKQSRTNALVGATVGTAALTGVLAIFTRWHGDKQPPPAAEPTALVVDRGAVVGAGGVF